MRGKEVVVLGLSSDDELPLMGKYWKARQGFQNVTEKRCENVSVRHTRVSVSKRQISRGRKQAGRTREIGMCLLSKGIWTSPHMQYSH